LPFDRDLLGAVFNLETDVRNLWEGQHIGTDRI
jgi:hypothetical protein